VLFVQIRYLDAIMHNKYSRDADTARLEKRHPHRARTRAQETGSTNGLRGNVRSAGAWTRKGKDTLEGSRKGRSPAACKWIGIDITHLAISFIEKRLKDRYNGRAKFEVVLRGAVFSGSTLTGAKIQAVA
jgi:hypothetical protein